MFNDFDPLAQLEQLQQQVTQLTANNHQLVNAINHQANALKLLNQQMVTMNNNIMLLDTQQKLLNLALEEKHNANT